jgi:hypothetical protein
MTRHAPMRQALGALVASLATVAPAAAHVTTAPAVAVPAAAPPSAALEAAASGFLPAWVGLVLLVAALALGRRRPRSSVAVALCLVLGVFAFEAGVHSVHHLDAGHSAITHCAIASATAHAPADRSEAVTVVPALEPGRLASAGAPCRPVSISLRPDSGRAPPALA